jgi:ABC-2 type transport system ATP-binding protein
MWQNGRRTYFTYSKERSLPEPVVVEGLIKHYGRVEALRGIDLEVRTGEVFGFLGPNGAGKSTTIRCLLGLLIPTAGRISVFGHDVAAEGVAVRRRIGYVPGELRLPERLTGRDLAGAFGHLRGRLDRGRLDDLGARLGAVLDRPLRELSTGNRRKIALLLAFLPAPDLLVLDEPTNGLDPLMQREFLALVQEARAAGATVFLSSHVLSEVQRAADRVAVLREGRLIASGSVEELRRRARQRVEVWFEDEPPAHEVASVPGVADVEIDGQRLTATLVGPIAPLLAVLAHSRVTSMLVQEPDLEEAFLDLYGAAA